MCIIFHKPKDIVLPKEVLENCFASNSHGAGFMVAKDNELIIQKGFFTIESFWEAYKDYENENLVAHFRWATHGTKNEENCHPFMVTNDLGFAHNGVISGVHVTGSDKSDTWHFNEKVLKELCSDFDGVWKHKTIKYLLMKKIGTGNKLVFLHASGEVAIYNADKGTQKYGCWFSNDDFEKKRYRSTTNTTTNHSSHNHHMHGNWDSDFDDYGRGASRYGDTSKKNDANASSVANSNATANLNANPNESEESSVKSNVRGKIFFDTPKGLIEISRVTLEDIGNENENIMCDDCNKVFAKTDLIVTSNLRMCFACSGQTV